MSKPKDINEIVAILKTLQPLPKKHYSYAEYPQTILTPPHPDLPAELARINGSLSSHADWDLPDVVDKIVSLNPKEIVISTSPWRKSVVGVDPTRWDRVVTDEIAWEDNNLARTRANIDKANAKYGKKILVSVVLTDQETYVSKTGDTGWNNAINEKNNITYRQIQKHFPGAKIIQYNRGVVTRGDGISFNGYYPPNGLGEYVNPSMYMPHEFRSDLDSFDDCVNLSPFTSGNNIIPNIALGGFTKRMAGPAAAWDFYFEKYRYTYSYLMGFMVNNPWCSEPIRVGRFAHFERSPFACFWPVCFDPNAPEYPWHYLAYVLGAQPNPKAPEWVDE